jgi:hypothetical protein
VARRETNAETKQSRIVRAAARTYIEINSFQEKTMAHHTNPRLTSAAVRIGTAAGRVNRRARGIAKTAKSARKQLDEQLEELTRVADRLARDLRRTKKRLQRALR